MTMIHVTDENFGTEVLQSSKPVLVDFWAEWCGPCKVIAPILEEIDQEIGDRIQIAKIDIDNNPDAPTQYGIRSIPTLMIFNNGELVDTKLNTAGSTKSALLLWIAQTI